MADIMFKVYFVKNGHTQEIRKFSMTRNVAFNYEHLRVKVREVCPVIQDDDFVITWKDSENDNVTISSDNELKIALNELQIDAPIKNVIKYYVTIKSKDNPQKLYQPFSESTPGSANLQKLQHTDVICDTCNKEIYGFRYKCLQCPDYDLCIDCEGKCHHSEHFMIRIPIPLQWKSYYGRKVSHILNKFMKKASCPVAEEVTADFGHSMRNDNAKNAQPYSPWWLDTCSAYLSDWTNLTNGILLPEQKNKVTEGHVKEPQAEKKERNATEATPSTSKTTPEDKRLEFLKTISENIAQFLDPLGIDVSVQVKSDKQSQSTNSVPEKDGVRESRNFCPFNVVRNDSAIPKPKENDESSKKDDSVSIASSSNISSVGQAQASQNNDTLKNDEWTLLDSENLPTLSAGLGSTASSYNNATPGLNNSIPELHTPAAAAAAASANLYPQLSTAPAVNNIPIYPNLPTDINAFWHKDQKIQNAVVTMMKMGFTNEGGWLTKLLVSTDGSINKAMDIITGAQ